MKLSASNIAWDPTDDDAVARTLCAAGFTGVEIAPTKRWESPIEATKREIADYRASWKKRGLRVVAMQSLLFGRADLQLFGNAVARRALQEYLTSLIEMAADLGATALVFGSPKNRQRKAMPMDQAVEIAAEFFRVVGAIATSRGCVTCIEPNPIEYDCDFINTMREAVELCDRIGSRGVRVQADIGSMLMSHDDVAGAIAAAGPRIGHVHVSEPNLAEITNASANAAAAHSLREVDYAGWVSVEMRKPVSGSAVEAIERVAARVAGWYGVTA